MSKAEWDDGDQSILYQKSQEDIVLHVGCGFFQWHVDGAIVR